MSFFNSFLPDISSLWVKYHSLVWWLNFSLPYSIYENVTQMKVNHCHTLWWNQQFSLLSAEQTTANTPTILLRQIAENLKYRRQEIALLHPQDTDLSILQQLCTQPWLTLQQINLWDFFLSIRPWELYLGDQRFCGWLGIHHVQDNIFSGTIFLQQNFSNSLNIWSLLQQEIQHSFPNLRWSQWLLLAPEQTSTMPTVKNCHLYWQQLWTETLLQALQPHLYTLDSNFPIVPSVFSNLQTLAQLETLLPLIYPECTYYKSENTLALYNQKAPEKLHYYTYLYLVT